MIKFNSNHLVAGFIKQLLQDFNLPKYKVYTKEFEDYHNWWLGLSDFDKLNTPSEDARVIETTPASAPNYTYYVDYIKDGMLQKYINGQWIESSDKHFHYNIKEPNQTRNLFINNNYYDPYTHEYLGDFLRFQRDFNNINLMPLYNCFGGKICSNLNLKLTVDNNPGDPNNPVIETSFDSARADYKIYVLPVKLFQNYTIAIDCIGKVEICCGFYDKYLDTSTAIEKMSTATYRQYVDLAFNHPIIYDALDVKYWPDNSTIPPRSEIIQREHNLKMFIKIPAENSSSITILEGDYTKFNDRIFDKIINPIVPTTFEVQYGTTLVSAKPKLELNNLGFEVYEYKKIIDKDEPKLEIVKKIPMDETSYVDHSFNLEISKYYLVKLYKYTAEKVKNKNITTTNSNLIKTHLGTGIIKTPVTQNFSTISIKFATLILDSNDSTDNITINKKQFIDNAFWSLEKNKVITNYEWGDFKLTTDNKIPTGEIYHIPDLNNRQFKPITNLQLLALNTGISYPFADRLIEYLLGNVITNLDNTTDNIKRVQAVMESNGHTFKYPGLWEQKIQIIAYDYMNQWHPVIGKPQSKFSSDGLGYIDKDVEKFYVNWTYSKDTTQAVQIPDKSISNIDIYEGLYNLEED